ncbi:Hypothetical predicted protein [Olea europaea subsp. europaea]|uniref:GCK domain-containing protein n=1 Tax=Olea europaea subsp. europaea TaxID=158383 RepID=A0A8S0PGY9_OLEEU|nr:Hypothetical predicted protein [Olea europaea subsp. europaea]
MSSPNSEESKPEIQPAHQPEIQEIPQEKETATEQVSEDSINEGNGIEEEEEEGECGFCLFMKGGGCKDTFIEWEKCIEEGEKNKEDIVEKCFQAEKASEEEAAKELEKERLSSKEDGGEESEIRTFILHMEIVKLWENVLEVEKAVEEEAAKELEKRERD